MTWRPSAATLALTLLAACAPKTLPLVLGADRTPLVAVDHPAVVARGRYLVNGPAYCVACHTPEGPLTPVDPEHPPTMVGGYAFGVPGGKVRAPNLTSHPETGIGGRTDAELVQALRYGRRPDGRALLPFMDLQGLSDDDLIAVLSYLRSLAPVSSDIRGRQINIFGRLLVSLFIKAKGPSSQPPRRSPTGPSIERGEYLTNYVSACAACHTRRTRTGGYKGERLSGGFHLPDQVDASRELVTPNLTPDPETGHITQWTEDAFVARFRLGRLIPGSPMPWSSFAVMDDSDLRSIYRYLMALPPTRHDVGPIMRAAYRPTSTVNLVVGGSSYDFAGTGTSLAVAGHFTWQWRPALAIEPGITYLAHDASSTLLFPEISVQAGLPSGPVRPYLGGGIGLTIPTSGGGGTHRSLHAVVGVRVPLTDATWSLRGEFRVRSPQQWGSVTADYMFGLAWKLP